LISYNYTDPSSGCSADEAQFELQVSEPAMPEGNDVSTQNQLIVDQASVPDLCVTGESILWYSSDEGSDLVEVGSCFNMPFTDSNPADGLMDEGIYTYYATQTIDGCESEYLELSLIVSGCPSINIGDDVVYCEGGTLDLSFEEGDYVSTLWSGTGSIYLDNINSESPVFDTETSTGVFDLKVTVEDSEGCVIEDSMQVTVNAIPIVDLNPVNTLCEGDDLTELTANVSEEGGIGTWTNAVGVSETTATFDPVTSGVTTVLFDYEVNGCEAITASLDVTVLELEELSITYGLTEMCEDQDVLSPTLSDGVGTFTISSSTEALDTEGNFTPSLAGPGEYEIEYSQVGEQCPFISSVVTLIVNEIPVIDLSANESEICAGVLLDLTAFPAGGEFSGTAVVDNQFDASLVDPLTGPFTITYNYEDPITSCVAIESSFELNVNQTNAPTGDDVALLNLEIVDVESVPELCVEGDNIQWYSSSDLGTSVASGNCYSTSFVDISPSDGLMDEGVYTIYATQTLNGCESESTGLSLTITACATEAPAATESYSICSGDDLPTLLSNATGENVEWTLSDGVTVIGTSENLDLSSFGELYDVPGIYTFLVSQEDGASLCRGPQAEVEVAVNETPTVVISGSDILCSGNETTLQAETTGDIEQYLWSNGTTSVSSISVSPDTTTSYSLLVQTVFGCSAESEIQIEVINTPDANVITVDNIVCQGDTLSIEAYNDPNENYEFSWYNSNDELIGTGSSVDITDGGEYYTRVINKGECESISEEFSIVQEYVSVNAFSLSDTVERNESVVLTAIGTQDVLSFVWETPDGEAYGEEIDFVILQNSTFIVEAQGEKCSDTASVQVFVVEDLAIPNGFAPNGDGLNDNWNIKGLANVTDLKISVFNRVGELVFETYSYDTPWDGTDDNGNILITGTYFYVIEIGGETYSGDVTILK